MKVSQQITIRTRIRGSFSLSIWNIMETVKNDYF